MAASQAATFADHVGELRRRLMWSLLFVAIGGTVGYFLNDKLLVVLQKPLNQTLYYTNPTGAFSFIIKVCVVFGLTVSLPVITYNLFAFFDPVLQTRTKRMFFWYIFSSVFLAGLGILFAYFVSLPAALHFLVNFGGGDIQALITANEYFNFVLAYLGGFALLFQLPLIMGFVNRITPLTPGKLLGATRYVVLASFVLAAIITPTPDPLNQTLMAGPVILLYFLSALGVIIKNKSSRRHHKKTVHQPTPVPQRVFHPQPVTAPAGLADTALPSAGTAKVHPAPVNNMYNPARKTVVPAYQKRQPQTATPTPAQPQSSSKPRLISDFV